MFDLDFKKYVLLGEVIRKVVEFGVEFVNSEVKNEVNILVLGLGFFFYNM